MKKSILILLTFLSSLTIYSQDVTGKWNGILKVQGTQLRLVININKTDNAYTATMDSPDQGAKEIPVTAISFENSMLKIEISNAKIEYIGTLNKENIFAGNFKQGGYSFPLDLSKGKMEKEVVIRPQEPAKPYPYYSEDITFENKKDNIVLAGTLTLPKKEGQFPVVILISGSGAQNRDEEALGHKPFLVLSDYLTKNGIAVLRFDDRGTAASKGDYKTAAIPDFATDVEAAISFLQTRKEINKKKIGLIGHSLGGIIAPMIASKSKDANFIVLLGGPGIPGDQLMLLQKEKTERQMGISESEISKSQELFAGAYKIVLNHKDNSDTDLKSSIQRYFREKLNTNSSEESINSIANQITSPEITSILKTVPGTYLEKVKCPVLALNGEKDLQVPAKVNLEAIKNALTKGGNKKFTIKELPNLNHLFQECSTGSPKEYAEIEQTISPIALDGITKWILDEVK
jgi:pimeloyl-ACP methyl ester carboxylesterase